MQRLTTALEGFLTSWCAHAVELRSAYEIVERLFLVLGVDETAQKATGCAIDSLFRTLQDCEHQLQLRLTDRLLTAYSQGEAIEIVSLQEFKRRVARAEISPETPVFDTSVRDKKAFQTRFQVPAAASWHKRYFVLDPPPRASQSA